MTSTNITFNPLAIAIPAACFAFRNFGPGNEESEQGHLRAAILGDTNALIEAFAWREAGDFAYWSARRNGKTPLSVDDVTFLTRLYQSREEYLKAEEATRVEAEEKAKAKAEKEKLKVARQECLTPDRLLIANAVKLATYHGDEGREAAARIIEANPDVYLRTCGLNPHVKCRTIANIASAIRANRSIEWRTSWRIAQQINKEVKEALID